MARFGAVLTAMVTPFDESGAVDFDEAAALARWLVEGGNQGLVIAGTTGESPTLSHDEQGRLFEVVRAAVSGMVNYTMRAIALANRIQSPP